MNGSSKLDTSVLLLTFTFASAIFASPDNRTTTLHIIQAGLNGTAGPLNRQMENTERCGLAGSGGQDPFGLRQQFNRDGILLLHTTTTTTTTTAATSAKKMPPSTSSTVVTAPGAENRKAQPPNARNTSPSDNPVGTSARRKSSNATGQRLRLRAGTDDGINVTLVDSPSDLLPPIGRPTSGVFSDPLNPDAPQLTRDQMKNITRLVVPRMVKRDASGFKRSMRQSKGITEALTNQICWQASISATVRLGTGRFARFNCGGTIIGSATILTAAHCILHPFTTSGSPRVFKPNQVSVRVGDRLSEVCTANNSVSPAPACAQSFEVSKIVSHPDYNPILLDNDIALILLSRPIDLTDSPCACSLCLSERSPDVDEACMISGSYGDDERNLENSLASPAKWLRIKTQRASMTLPNCGFNVDDTSGNITNLETTICAGGLKDQDTCNGDSGGALVCMDPLTTTHYVAGVASFAAPCGVALGGMYTKVSAFLKWILSNTGSDVTVSH